jgi:hypothetical protein
MTPRQGIAPGDCFFQKECFSIIFKSEIQKSYGEFANGKKLKTNCQGE